MASRIKIEQLAHRSRIEAADGAGIQAGCRGGRHHVGSGDMTLSDTPGLDVGGRMKIAVVLPGPRELITGIFTDQQAADVIRIRVHLGQFGQDHHHRTGSTHLGLLKTGGLQGLFIVGSSQDHELPLLQAEGRG